MLFFLGLGVFTIDRSSLLQASSGGVSVQAQSLGGLEETQPAESGRNSSKERTSARLDPLSDLDSTSTKETGQIYHALGSTSIWDELIAADAGHAVAALNSLRLGTIPSKQTRMSMDGTIDRSPAYISRTGYGVLNKPLCRAEPSRPTHVRTVLRT